MRFRLVTLVYSRNDDHCTAGSLALEILNTTVESFAGSVGDTIARTPSRWRFSMAA
jgi:hypothetical protein